MSTRTRAPRAPARLPAGPAPGSSGREPSRAHAARADCVLSRSGPFSVRAGPRPCAQALLEGPARARAGLAHHQAGQQIPGRARARPRRAFTGPRPPVRRAGLLEARSGWSPTAPTCTSSCPPAAAHDALVIAHLRSTRTSGCCARSSPATRAARSWRGWCCRPRPDRPPRL